jgi:hypothetical protein
MKHTPGPWDTKEGQIYPEESGRTLALITYYDRDNKEDVANARLIAAAPELLEACEAVYANLNPAYLHNRLCMRLLQKAIEKAKGGDDIVADFLTGL